MQLLRFWAPEVSRECSWSQACIQGSATKYI